MGCLPLSPHLPPARLLHGERDGGEGDRGGQLDDGLEGGPDGGGGGGEWCGGGGVD